MDREVGVAAILFLISTGFADKAIDCGMNEKLEKDKCIPCPECPVGTGLSQPCGFGSGAYLKCEPCPSGFYNDNPSGSVCIQCTNCSIYNRRYRYGCRAEINAECGQCLDGYYDNSKNLPHRNKLYSCKRCEGGHCSSSTTTPIVLADGVVVDKAPPSWKPVVGVLVPLFVVFFLCYLVFKYRRLQVLQICNRLAETCACFCLKRSDSFFRRRAPRTTDEENLCSISGTRLSGDGFVKVSAAGRQAASGEDDQRTEGTDCETRPPANGAQTDEIRRPQSGLVAVHFNTDDGNQKSIALKTKAIPGSRGQQASDDSVSVPAVEGSSYPEHSIQFNVPIQVNNYEESLTSENRVGDAPELCVEPNSQDFLDELLTSYDRSGFLDDGLSDASTLLIRGQEASDTRRSLAPSQGQPQQQLQKVGNPLGDIAEHSPDATTESTAMTTSDNCPFGRSVITSSAAKTTVNDSAGKHYSGNRHAQNRQPHSLQGHDASNASTEDEPLHGTSPQNDRRCSGMKNVVKANGNPGHIVVNNGGISIQVFNYVPRDLEKPDDPSPARAVDSPDSARAVDSPDSARAVDSPDSARAVDSPDSARAVPEDSSPSPFLPSRDSDQTYVKRPFPSSARCRPKNEQSFPSFTRFPVQETCDGPPCS